MYEHQIEEARNMAPYVVRNITAADTTPWLVAQYVPDLGSGGASATIALVEAFSMTFVVDSTVPAGLDVIGTTTGGVVLTSGAAYNTMGELVDYINSKPAWRAYLVGCLRADKSSLLLAKSAALCSGANGLTFYSNTSDSDEVSMAVSGEKFVNNGINGHVKDRDDFCENILCYAGVNLTCTGVTNTLKIYSGKAGETEVELLSTTFTSATLKELGATDPVTPYIKANVGERLVIRASCGSAFSAYTTFNILGQTAVWRCNRIVDSKNY